MQFLDSTSSLKKREYKRLWMAAKRANIKLQGFESITIDLPINLKKKLGFRKPKNLSYGQYILHLLRDSTSGRPSKKLCKACSIDLRTEKPKAVKEKASIEPATPSVGRNEQCPCGSGLKFKRCCGKS